MDTLHLSIALGPVAIYGLALGLVHLSQRPLLTTGTREIYAVGLAICGWIVVGPLALLMPGFLTQRLGISAWDSIVVWGFLLVTYLLVLSMFSLLLRPRLVVYNVSVEGVRTALNNLLERHDWEHQWAGNCLVLPPLGVQFQIECTSSPYSVSLVATTGHQQHRGWHYLERELAAELAKLDAGYCRGSALFLRLSVAVLAVIGILLSMENPHQVVASLEELWLP